MDDDIEYEDFPDTISFKGFEYSKYRTSEDSILRPQLEALGFYGIVFRMGESDSFGPLSRICICTDQDGKLHRFFYG